MTIFSKNLEGGMTPLAPLATPMGTRKQTYEKQVSSGQIPRKR